MSSQVPDITHAQPRPTRWETAVQWLMSGMLIFAPLAYGATEPWSQQIVVFLVAAALLCLVADRVQRGAGGVWSWTFVPIALFLGLLLLQLVPLPGEVLRWLSPATLELKQRLLGDGGGNSHRLSFYPHATRSELQLLLAVVAVFFIVVQVYRRPRRIKQLLAVVAIAAAGVVSVALYHEALGGGAIYPGGRVHYHGAGPFINHSHFAQFANLGIGAALALMLVHLNERLPREASFEVLKQRLRDPQLRVVWALAALIVGAALAIFVTLSRGGTVALISATAVTALVMLWRFRGHGGELSVFVLALAALTALLYWGFDPVYERLATLRKFDHAQGIRWRIVTDMIPMWASFPVFGIGLGAFAEVFPMYDTGRTSSLLTTHAENEYAQLLAETGLIGLLLAGVFLAAIFGAWARTVRCASSASHLAAFGLGFGLLAIAIQSLSDFGQHIPAIAMVTAVCCGLLVNVAGLPAPKRPSRRERARATDEASAIPPAPRRGQRPATARTLWSVGGALGFAALAWAGLGLDHARQAEAAWAQARTLQRHLEAVQWQAPDETYVRLLGHAERAVELQPGHVAYRYALNYFRWRSISRTVDPETGEVLLTDAAVSHTRRIVDELHGARRLCPTHGPLYALAGQLELFALDRREAGARHVRLAHELTSHHGYVSFVAGELAAEEGRWDAALEKFGRAWRQHDDLREPIIELLLAEHERPELAHELVAGDRSWLLRLARRLERIPGHEAQAAEYRAEARALLGAAAETSNRPAGALAQLGSIAADAEDHEAAVDYYRRALAHDYGQVRWRYELARSLAALGETEQAMREAQLCLRLRPEMERAKTLLADLSVR